jgi:hypothetical protein
LLITLELDAFIVLHFTIELITRTEDGYVSKKGRVGFEFEVIEDDYGITATYIRYRDVRAAIEII